MSDPLDLPDPDEGAMSLVYPFVLCASKDGPYDDAAFVSGFRCGAIDAALQMAENSPMHIGEMTFTIATEEVRQMELAGMARGFPHITVETAEGLPEWSFITFRRTELKP